MNLFIPEISILEKVVRSVVVYVFMLVAFRFTGNESEIDVLHPGGGKHKPEFVEWRWEPLKNLPELVIPFKRKVYERVVAEFLPLTKI